MKLTRLNIARLICRMLGHKWSNPERTNFTELTGKRVYVQTCSRCGAVNIGMDMAVGAKQEKATGEWIATEWARRCDVDACDPYCITVALIYSPFFVGVRFAVKRREYVLTKDGKWESNVGLGYCEWHLFSDFDSAVKAADTASGRDI